MQQTSGIFLHNLGSQLLLWWACTAKTLWVQWYWSRRCRQGQDRSWRWLRYGNLDEGIPNPWQNNLHVGHPLHLPLFTPYLQKVYCRNHGMKSLLPEIAEPRAHIIVSIKNLFSESIFQRWVWLSGNVQVRGKLGEIFSRRAKGFLKLSQTQVNPGAWCFNSYNNKHTGL